MLTPSEALGKIFERLVPLGQESVNLIESVDRTLGQDITAGIDLPPFDNSAMDGFAVVAEDVAHASKESPVILNVNEKIRAGLMPTTSVKSGEAVMIMTGAPLPQGATAVVIKEATEIDGNGAVRVLFPTSVGDNIRPKGEDVQKSNLLLKAGCRIRPYEIAVLAAQGFSEIAVIRKPIVGVLATGDKLVEIGQVLGPGKIHNSNGPALLSALRHWDIEGNDFGIAKDEPVELEKKVLRALESCDVLLISGGVSVGDFDYTKTTLEKCGVNEVFWKVAIKPGKPLFFGVTKDNKYVFGLPGNPISALVCLEEFVRPALEKLQGFVPKHPSYHLKGRALNDYPLPANRRQYLFCQASSVGGNFELKIIRPQGSAMMGMATQANALALPDEDARQIKKGDDVPFRWLK
jgi:molybdopterin molybdotransferase